MEQSAPVTEVPVDSLTISRLLERIEDPDVVDRDAIDANIYIHEDIFIEINLVEGRDILNIIEGLLEAWPGLTDEEIEGYTTLRKTLFRQRRILAAERLTYSISSSEEFDDSSLDNEDSITMDDIVESEVEKQFLEIKEEYYPILADLYVKQARIKTRELYSYTTLLNQGNVIPFDIKNKTAVFKKAVNECLYKASIFRDEATDHYSPVS
jgi:hypothetical protein